VNVTPDIEAEIDLREIVIRLWRHRLWILLSVVLFAVVFTAAALLITPVYRATAVLVPANTNQSGGGLSGALGQLGGLAALAGVDVNDSIQVEEALAVMNSREFTEAFIRDRNLLPMLFASEWDAEARAWKGAPEDHPTLARGFKYFDSRVRTVSRDRTTRLVTVSVEWRDPVLAADWVNDLVGRLNAEMRSRAIAATEASVGYLEKELATTSTIETKQAIARLMEAQINQKMLANVTQEYAFRIVDRALPPDPKDVVWPNKLLLVALGPIVGLIVGVAAVVVLGSLSRRS
jgi:uncharacterized protein involved in exopolysaccharide biosynthesis